MEEINFRDIDLETKAFQSDKDGKIIKSKRTFGIELEMVGTTKKGMSKLSHDIHESFGVAHDGSIEPRGAGIEVQSPILRGEAGEKAIIDAVAIAKKNGLGVNSSCGMHCHIDAEDFLPKYTQEYRMHFGRNIKTKTVGILFNGTEKHGKSVLAYVGKYSVYRLAGVKYLPEYEAYPLIKFTSDYGAVCDSLDERGVKIASQMMNVWSTDVNDDNEREFIEGEVGKNTLIAIFKGPQEANRMRDILSACEEQRKAGTDFCSFAEYDVETTNRIAYMKTLMAFYTVFDDVILSMLGGSRRDNRFCKQMRERYSLAEILTINNFEEFDKVWYKMRTRDRGTNGGMDYEDIIARKGDGHDSSRYVGVNFHSLLRNNKTLEIRYHGGTLDSGKILYWTALHQHFIDSIANGSIKMKEIADANKIIRFEDKLKAFYKVSKLTKELQTYVEGRIKTYNN